MKAVSICVLMLLTGCSRGETNQQAQASVTNQVAADDSISVANDAAADAALGNIVAVEPTATPAAANAAEARPATAKTFPVAFRGRWGMTANDCDPEQDYAAKGLMVVAADRLTFYESRATPAAVTVASPTRLTAKLNWSGEGQTWTQTSDLTLGKAGTTLVRTSTDEGDLSYSKCPA